MNVETQDIGGAVVIGASVGAIDALGIILPALPPDFPQPVFVVVHIPADKASILAELFSGRCNLPVKEAEDKEPAAPGTIYFAPPDYHLLVEPDFRMSLSNEEPVLYSRPAVDVLFESAADAYGHGLTAVVLTGASSDCARGLRAVCDAGGRGLIQRPDTAMGEVMPRSAMELCPEARVLLLQDIARTLATEIPIRQ